MLTVIKNTHDFFQQRFPVFLEFTKFCIVGTSGLIVDILVYISLQSLFGLSYGWARAGSFWAAASSNWVLNRNFTFADRQRTKRFSQWIKYVLFMLMGFALNWGTFYVLVSNIPFFHQYDLLALLAGVGVGVLFNFTVARTFIFRYKPQGE